jgi:hypothetical protein
VKLEETQVNRKETWSGLFLASFKQSEAVKRQSRQRVVIVAVQRSPEGFRDVELNLNKAKLSS